MEFFLEDQYQQNVKVIWRALKMTMFLIILVYLVVGICLLTSYPRVIGDLFIILVKMSIIFFIFGLLAMAIFRFSMSQQLKLKGEIFIGPVGIYIPKIYVGIYGPFDDAISSKAMNKKKWFDQIQLVKIKQTMSFRVLEIAMKKIDHRGFADTSTLRLPVSLSRLQEARDLTKLLEPFTKVDVYRVVH